MILPKFISLPKLCLWSAPVGVAEWFTNCGNQVTEIVGNWGERKYELWQLSLGMAIFAWLTDTRFGPTLMGRILPGPIKNRVRFGFFLKKPEAGPGRGSGFYKNLPRTRTRLDPLKTKITKKNPSIYINL